MDVIKFKDLSVFLKFAILGGFIGLISYGLAFIMGFIQGFLGI